MRRLAVLALGMLLCSTSPTVAAEADPVEGATYVLVHGAWGGGWAWKEVADLLTARGHHVYRPTLTGQGERRHLISPDISLETHIEDIVNVFLFEDLKDVVLMGHSYGGMVITGVAERVPERIRHLIYLDAHLPLDGDSVMSRRSPEAGAQWLERMVQDGLLVPPWVQADQRPPHDVPQSLKTFTDTISLTSEAARALAGTYILTTEGPPEEDDFFRFVARARARGFAVHVMQTDHNAQWSAPKELAELLDASPRKAPVGASATE